MDSILFDRRGPGIALSPTGERLKELVEPLMLSHGAE